MKTPTEARLALESVPPVMGMRPRDFAAFVWSRSVVVYADGTAVFLARNKEPTTYEFYAYEPTSKVLIFRRPEMKELEEHYAES